MTALACSIALPIVPCTHSNYCQQMHYSHSSMPFPVAEELSDCQVRLPAVYPVPEAFCHNTERISDLHTLLPCQAMLFQIFLPKKQESACQKISRYVRPVLNVNVLPMDLFHSKHRCSALLQLLLSTHHPHLRSHSPPHYSHDYQNQIPENGKYCF